MSQTPRPAHAVGHKFDAAGAPLPFPGNTVICPVAADSALFAEGVRVQEACQEAGLAGQFAWLPPDSFHVTLFDLVCDRVRLPERWSRELPLDASIEEADAFMRERLATIPWPAPPRMTVTGLGELGGDHTLRLILEPDGQEQAAALGTFREAAADASGVRHPVHDRYRFHMSLAYPLVILEADQIDAFRRFEADVTPGLRRRLAHVELGAPYLSRFETMFDFPKERVIVK